MKTRPAQNSQYEFCFIIYMVIVKSIETESGRRMRETRGWNEERIFLSCTVYVYEIHFIFTLYALFSVAALFFTSFFTHTRRKKYIQMVCTDTLNQ